MADRTTASRPVASALALIAALVCLVAGLASGRPDTAALATPFALIALAGRRSRRPSGSADRPGVSITSDPGPTADGRVRLLLAPVPEAHSATRLIVVTLAPPGSPAAALVLSTDEECPLLVDAPLSGEATVLAVGTQDIRADLSDPSPFREAPPARVSVLPPVGPPLAGPASRRLVGLTGPHTSRRPGTGGELRSVAPRQAGDPLRRIDWRATARRSTDQDRLMVRRTFADAEASAHLVVDSGYDVPGGTAEWFAPDSHQLAAGSLHVARMAAATVASSYLAAGDRVGLDDLSGTRRPVRTAGGARHLEQLRARLADTSVVQRRRRRRDPVPPQGAVVMVFSPFFDDEPGRLLKLWDAQGHLVVGVDCLPPLERTETSAAQSAAVRLTLLRRSLRFDALRRSGIPVLSAATLDPSTDLSTDSSRDLSGGLRLLARTARRRSGRPPVHSAGGLVP